MEFHKIVEDLQNIKVNPDGEDKCILLLSNLSISLSISGIFLFMVRKTISP